jgi:hypothetical protein
MATLSAAIVNHRVASVRDVEEALARQALYGGDLATNLLEVTSVSEADLTEVLAVSLGLEPAPAEELRRPADATLALVPADLAKRHNVYPLEESAGKLVLAVSAPLPPDLEADLGFALGVSVVQKAALEVRVRQAVARDYGIQLDLRFERLLAKLDGLMGPMPSPLPREPRAALGAWPLPQPGSVPPVTAEGSDLPPRAIPPSLLPPYDPATAERDVARATTRDELLETFLDFSAQHFEYCALFTIQGDFAQGRDAHGPGRARARMGELTLTLDQPGALREVRDSGELRLGPLGDTEADLALTRELERPLGRAVLLLPVLLRKRCVLMLYGDQGEADVQLEAVSNVTGLAPLVSSALERLILQRKLSGASSVVPSVPSSAPPRVATLPSAPPSAPPGRVSEPPTMAERAQALVEALGARPRSRPPPARVSEPAGPSDVPAPVAPEPRPASVESRPAPVEPPPSSVKPRPIVTVGVPPSEPPPRSSRPPRVAGSIDYTALPRASARTSEPPEPKPVITVARVVSIGPTVARPKPVAADQPDTPIPLTRRSSTSMPRVLPPERRQTPPGGIVSPAAQPPSAPPPSRPRLELVVEAKPTEDHTPEIAVGSIELGEDWEIEDGVASTDGKAPLAPASRYVHYGARVPRRSQPFADPNLPSIIVDVESDCLALLERMMEGDERAQELLLQMGESAAHVLAARLPGPLAPARPSQLATGRPLVPSRANPLLATLVRLGEAAVASVIERSRDPDPVVRAWATRVLGELPWPESARAVAVRIADEEPEVRSAALAAGRMLQAERDSRAALRQALEAVCFDSAQPAVARGQATNALGDLRDDRAVPALIALLEDPDSDLAATAHRALVGLTAQDFGPSRFRYTGWWTSHQTAHRIEWLIDALTHERAEIRRAAGEELKAVTKEYFGYYDDLPPAERASAQQRYREWWNSRGKALFA